MACHCIKGASPNQVPNQKKALPFPWGLRSRSFPAVRNGTLHVHGMPESDKSSAQSVLQDWLSIRAAHRVQPSGSVELHHHS